MTEISYFDLCDFDLLHKAHLAARRCRRAKHEIIKFELDLCSCLTKLLYQLNTKSYQVDPYFSFSILDPKPRVIYALRYKDRIVQHLLCDNVLEPYFSKKIIYDNAGCVKDRGQHFALKRLKKFLKSHYHKHGIKGYFLKCDIAKFFPSLSHEIIKKNMSSHLNCPDIKNLFNQIVDSFTTPKNFLTKHNILQFEKIFVPNVGFRMKEIKRGVPIGNQSSQLIGMYYLDPIDRFIKEKLQVKHYIRYMDDFILIHHDRAFLKNALISIKEKLSKELKLTVNKKTQIVPIKNSITFLGNRIIVKDNGSIINRIIPRTIKKFKLAVKKINKSAILQKPNFDTIFKARATTHSYKGHCKHSASKGKSIQVAKKLNISIGKLALKQALKAEFAEEFFNDKK